MRKGHVSRVGLAAALVAASLVTAVPSALAAGRFVDDDGSVHEGYIEAIAAAGITHGCNPPVNDRYCPQDTVTRGEMAAFLTRALGLGPPDRDYFTDDEASVFEDDINRLAAAAVTAGCGTGVYCPNLAVTRGEMAAFLRRAFAFGPPDRDYFTDDEASIFEDDINRLATSGVTAGCSGSLFCPADPVTRAQMASFLGRALGLTPLPPGPSPPPPPPGEYACTEVIGFSQTGQWFDQFGIDGWQARIQSGSSIEKWTNPDFNGWTAPLRNPQCNRSEVDRVLLTISGGGRPADAWAADVADVVDVIRSKYSAVKLIMLQPVVGGPGHAECFFGGNSIRASRNHPDIDQGIGIVVAGEDGSVVAGASPEVGSCSHYADQLGHLTADGAAHVGQQLAAFYG